MIELPEAYVLAEQIDATLRGKLILNVTANASPHKFAWFTGDPDGYQEKLSGKRITGANAGTGYTCGGNVEIICEDTLLVINTPIKYHAFGEKLPLKHQLLLEFEDNTYMTCTVQMWGGMLCYPLTEDARAQNRTPTMFDDAFDWPHFQRMWSDAKPTLSAKALLATEQRIPGVGNGVIQDILFHARIHPKTRLEQLDAHAQRTLFDTLQSTLLAMRAQGGRDTERDLFGCPGGYRTVLSAKTMGNPCPVCGDTIVRQAYLGGNVYYCPTCQPYQK